MPHGYSIAILLALVPPVWKRFMDPYAHAIMKNEKLTEEKRKELDTLAFTTLLGIACFVTVLCFIF